MRQTDAERRSYEFYDYDDEEYYFSPARRIGQSDEYYYYYEDEFYPEYIERQSGIVQENSLSYLC